MAYQPDPEREQLTLIFDEALPPRAAVHLVFKYALRQGLSGFYRWVGLGPWGPV